MAEYKIMYWKKIPSQIRVWDEKETVKRVLPGRFQKAIDGAAMAEGSTSSKAYLAGWSWGAQEKREGSARDVSEALLAELDEAYPKSHLAVLVKELAQSGANTLKKRNELEEESR